jgi:hypothetical protein
MTSEPIREVDTGKKSKLIEAMICESSIGNKTQLTEPNMRVKAACKRATTGRGGITPLSLSFYCLYILFIYFSLSRFFSTSHSFPDFYFHQSNDRRNDVL